MRVVVCAIAILAGTAQPADAIWRWLEHMSGPGWYDGFALEFKEIARYPGLPESEVEALKVVEAEKRLNNLIALRLGELRGKGRAAVLHALDERINAEHKRLGFFGVVPTVSLPSSRRIGDITQPRNHTVGWSVGMLWSTINRLSYDPAVNVEDTQVWIVTGGPFYDYRLRGRFSRVEVGGSVEGYVFFGRTTRTMPRIALEPRATIRLATIRDENTKNPAINLKVRVGSLWVLPGFHSEDFGAIPGTPLGPERLTSVRLVLDMECLPWKKGSC